MLTANVEEEEEEGRQECHIGFVCPALSFQRRHTDKLGSQPHAHTHTHTQTLIHNSIIGRSPLPASSTVKLGFDRIPRSPDGTS